MPFPVEDDRTYFSINFAPQIGQRIIGWVVGGGKFANHTPVSLSKVGYSVNK